MRKLRLRVTQLGPCVGTQTRVRPILGPVLLATVTAAQQRWDCWDVDTLPSSNTVQLGAPKRDDTTVRAWRHQGHHAQGSDGPWPPGKPWRVSTRGQQDPLQVCVAFPAVLKRCSPGPPAGRRARLGHRHTAAKSILSSGYFYEEHTPSPTSAKSVRAGGFQTAARFDAVRPHGLFPEA